jgi:hypothetical protein
MAPHAELFAATMDSDAHRISWRPELMRPASLSLGNMSDAQTGEEFVRTETERSRETEIVFERLSKRETDRAPQKKEFQRWEQNWMNQKASESTSREA